MGIVSEKLYAEAERYVRGRMEQELSDKLTYHRPWHTFEDVMPAAERLAIAEGIAESDSLLLRLAVLFHDLGYIERYSSNEPIGALLAADYLSTQGVPSNDVERVKRMILATRAHITGNGVVQEAGGDILERIICDADLDNFGRPDFLWISSLIRKELESFGIRQTDREWYERQFNMLKHHTYYTLSARSQRDAGKLENMRKVEELLLSF
jgi:predicted metal-dependent HD superfamily phosphohydrolase